MNYKILDSENGVAFCRIADMPEKCRNDIEKQGGNHKDLTTYYDKENDLVILNRDHRYYELYAGIVTEAMQLTEESLLNLFNIMPDDMLDDLGNLLKILIIVKKYRKMVAAAGVIDNEREAADGEIGHEC